MTILKFKPSKAPHNPALEKFLDAFVKHSGIETAASEAYVATMCYGPEAGLQVWQAWHDKQGTELTPHMREQWFSIWR